MAVAIRIENLSKQYRLGLVGTGTLSHDLRRWWHLMRGREDPYLKIGEINDRSTKGKSEYIWALKDINFEVEQGEVLGIIGKNGAGKSTLLKILSKVTAPTTGTISYKGRIGSLLEVGTGFNPDLTGRENIYLNGAILGMRKNEISRKFDEIVDFSGCDRYIDTPVKRYSSGMMVRLAFAVAAFLEPEILVVDEVLAVGDAEFQKKAIGKMQDVSRNEGRTVLFVSHNMNSVQQLCNKGIILQNGYVLNTHDSISDLIKHYLNNSIYQSGYNTIWVNDKNQYFNDHANPMRFYFTDEMHNVTNGILRENELLFINIIFDIKKAISNLTIGYSVFDDEGRQLYWSYQADSIGLSNVELKEGINHLRSKIPNNVLNEGLYRIEICGCIHAVKWFFEPGCDNPSIYLTVQGNSNKSPFWNFKRPTLIAPVLKWNVFHY